MQADYDLAGSMPVAAGSSLLLHAVLAIIISSGVISSATPQPSLAVTVTLTRSDQAPTDAQHLASHNQLALPGALAESLAEQRASATLALMNQAPIEPVGANDLAAKVQELHSDLNKVQQNQAQNTRLGSVAARRALDASYLRQWVNRVEMVGNAALSDIGNARGDVRLLVIVDQFGILLDVTVLESSGFPHLDKAAIRTVRDAAPYPSFPPELRAHVDKLEIVRTWQFRP